MKYEVNGYILPIIISFAECTFAELFALEMVKYIIITNLLSLFYLPMWFTCLKEKCTKETVYNNDVNR